MHPKRNALGLTKIRAGLYRHDATGTLLVRTDGQYEGTGPRGGDQRGWEHAREDAYGLVIDSAFVYPSLRRAVEAIPEAAPDA